MFSIIIISSKMGGHPADPPSPSVPRQVEDDQQTDRLPDSDSTTSSISIDVNTLVEIFDHYSKPMGRSQLFEIE